MPVEVEFLPWLSERLGGSGYRSRPLKWLADAGGESVGELFRRLATNDAAFGELVFDVETGRLRDDILVVMNERHLDLAGGLGAPVQDGSRLTLLAALAGGCR